VSRDLVTSAKRMVPLPFKRAIQRRLRKPTSLSATESTHYRAQVGGLWEQMGELQLNFLVEQGLKDHHTFLDIGCGSMRGGIKFAQYLRAGHYFGVDANAHLISAGKQELKAAGISPDDVAIRHTADFELEFGLPFDFALAQSVFTHLPLNSIQACLLSVATVLSPTGRFYATFFNNYLGKNHREPIRWKGSDSATTVTSYPDRDPFHYDLSAFQWICEDLDLDVTYIGDWGHPRQQEMLMFKNRT
jgi:SAM-dependent methyltransferase